MYEISTQEWMTVIYQAYDVCKQQYENSHSHWKIDNKFHITIDNCLQRISKDCCEIDFTGLGPRGTDDGNIRVDLISVMNEARCLLLDHCMKRDLPKLKKLYNDNKDKYKYCVYRFINNKGDIIYIGKSKRIVTRLTKEHFTKNGHLPSDCYNQTVKVEICMFKTEADMMIAELYFINIYKPYYNTDSKTVDSVTVSINGFDDMEWEEFNSKKIHKAKPSKSTYIDNWNIEHPRVKWSYMKNWN